MHEFHTRLVERSRGIPGVFKCLSKRFRLGDELWVQGRGDDEASLFGNLQREHQITVAHCIAAWWGSYRARM
jgi:hypothetical protein